MILIDLQSQLPDANLFQMRFVYSFAAVDNILTLSQLAAISAISAKPLANRRK